jgi:protein arginine N-methyltransferase 1
MMILFHRAMLADSVRCKAYKKAIFEVVRPGDIVLDIGTGTGLLAYFAVMAGAKRVYAIEVGDIIEYARKIAAANHWADKVVFIKDLSTHVTLNEKVDVVVSEIMGSMAIEEDIVTYMADAKSRFLRQGGILVPSQIDIEMAPIDSPDSHRNLIGSWGRRYGIDFGPIREKAVNCKYTQPLSRENLIASSQKIHTMDLYGLNPADTVINRSLCFHIKRRGMVHGLAGWFTARLTDNVVISTFSKSKPTHWGTYFFPIQKPISVKRGERIFVKVSAHTCLDSTIWSWSIENESGVRYNHSAFKNISLGKKKWLRFADDLTPVVGEREKEIVQFVMDQSDGRHSVRQISQEILKRYPELFPTYDKAKNTVVHTLSNTTFNTPGSPKQ